jgi:hypothetical protein
MKHLEPFRSRKILPLPLAEKKGWQLKRYAILADHREYDEDVTAAATKEALDRLPRAGGLNDAENNHGVGFQILHLAEQLSGVSPVFYWQWGSVLASIDQMRADWKSPKKFENGAAEVVGCVWEMQIVSFEVEAWTRTVLASDGEPVDRLALYLEARFV